jgi:dUTP pyrophosphatase
MSTRIGWGSPVSAIERASASTDGGRSRGRSTRVSVRLAAVSLPIDLVQLDLDLPLPTYAHQGDAGLDLVARETATIAAAGGRVLMPTGISIAIPLGWCGLLMPRSGLALKHGIGIVNAPGLIDSAYRGEIKVVLINTDPSNEYLVARGDRVAQLVIQRVEEVSWNVVDALDGADRGGGFGHSGR